MSEAGADHLAARREQVIRVAVTLFAEQGFAGTTMADVVAASGLPADAVGQCFPSKTDLVLAVVAGQVGPAGDEPTAGGFAETPAGMIGRLTAYMSSADGCTQARLLAQIWGDAAVSPEIAAVVRDSHQRAEAHLARLAGGDPVTARVALAALIGLAALVAADIPVDTKAFRQAVTRLFDQPE